MTGRGALALTAAAAALLAPAAQAQDWQTLDVAPGISAVAVQWDSGAAITILCRREGLIATFQLAQPLSAPGAGGGELATVSYDRPGRLRTEAWRILPSGGMLESPAPERFARRLLLGAPIEITVTPPEGPRQRYPLDLPMDAGDLTGLLEDCEVPLHDPRDNPPPTHPTRETDLPAVAWIERALPQLLAATYPRRALERGLGGRATVQCIVLSSGRLGSCEVISEYPRGAGFGRATVEAAERGMRLGGVEGASLPEAVVGERIEVPLTWYAPR